MRKFVYITEIINPVPIAFFKHTHPTKNIKIAYIKRNLV